MQSHFSERFCILRIQHQFNFFNFRIDTQIDLFLNLVKLNQIWIAIALFRLISFSLKRYIYNFPKKRFWEKIKTAHLRQMGTQKSSGTKDKTLWTIIGYSFLLDIIHADIQSPNSAMSIHEYIAVHYVFSKSLHNFIKVLYRNNVFFI